MDTLPVSADISVPPNTSPRTNTSACFHPSTSTVSRLISVVEIIKREYLKILETTHSTKLHGLHQYNEIGILEDLGLVVTSTSNQTADAIELESAREVERSQNIIEAISGKHLLVLSSQPGPSSKLESLMCLFSTRRKETPFMRITLSTSELPELVEKNATYGPAIHTDVILIFTWSLAINHQLAGCSLNLPKDEHGNEQKRSDRPK